MRRDVPYPDKCGLRCQLAEIWTLLRGKLRSLNGVNGDGDGNIRIVAGNNVSITEDPGGNSIEISASDGRGIETVNQQTPDASGNLKVLGNPGINIGTTSNGITIGADTEVLATQQQIGEIMSGDQIVGQARNAVYAEDAGSQTYADSADTADHATTADSADTADHATTAASAAKLTTARTVRTDLQSSAAASFDGTADVTPGVTGVLPIANGGTGSASKNFVDLSTDQTAGGAKTWTGRANIQYNGSPHVYFANMNLDYTALPSSRQDLSTIPIGCDRNYTRIITIYNYLYQDGHQSMIVSIKNANGTNKSVTIQAGDLR